jgi:hypothetical protein
MIQYFIDHPVWIFVLAAVTLLTIFVCIKAAQASSKRYAANEKTIKKIKEENELCNEFAILTESLIASAEADRLFKGVALNLQKRVADKEDIMAEFEALTQEQKEIYALYTVIDDGEKRLSAFFENCGKPLTDVAFNAVERLLDGEAVDVFKKEFDAFDGDNETVSFIPEEIKKLDESFGELAPIDGICKKAGAFIKSAPEKFI